MKYNYNKLRGRIVEKYGSLQNFSDAISVSYTALSRKMNNITAISQSEVSEWSKLLDIEPGELASYFFALEVQSN